jgi:hypothetical protein
MFVFKTGETEAGEIDVLVLISVFIVKERVFVIVYELITMVIESVEPALTPSSNADVKQTKVEAVEV